MQHPSLIQWEKLLKKLIDDLDDYLEDRYGNMYHLHPARSKRGTTTNKAHDGLFDVVASFTLGLGTKHGKGYIVDVHISTLEKVPDEIEKQIHNAAVKHLRKKISEFFPEKDLKVSRNKKIIKIHGDLSLGPVDLE